MDPHSRFPPSIAIPPILHSFLEGGPFKRCLTCHADLMDETVYLIEKAFKGTEVIFEYALCLDCQGDLSREVSVLSRRRLAAHFDERVDRDIRHQDLLERADGTIEAWIDRCLLTKTPRDAAGEFQIVALAEGSELLLGDTPFLLSAQAIEELFPLLSRETRDRMDDFIGENLGMPSEWKEVGILF